MYVRQPRLTLLADVHVRRGGAVFAALRVACGRTRGTMHILDRSCSYVPECKRDLRESLPRGRLFPAARAMVAYAHHRCRMGSISWSGFTQLPFTTSSPARSPAAKRVKSGQEVLLTYGERSTQHITTRPAALQVPQTKGRWQPSQETAGMEEADKLDQILYNTM